MKLLLAGVRFSMDQGLPTHRPSDAPLARSNTLTEFMPLPPMNGTFRPSWRACTMMGAPSASSADSTMASGLVALILVSCALKSTSPLAKVSVVVTGIFWSSSAFLKLS